MTQLEEWKTYWQPLSDQEIIQLATSPVATVGLHAYYHDNLGILAHEDALALLQKGKNYLENLLQQETHSLAYADGSYTRSLVAAAADLGIREQYAVDYLFDEDHDDPRLRERLTINPFTSLAHQMSAIGSGTY